MRLLPQHFFTRKSLPLFIAAGLALSGCGDPQKSVEEYVSSAESSCQKEDLKTCEIELKNALQQTPDHSKARFLLGKLYYDIGNYQGAAKELRHALAGAATELDVYPLFAKAMLKSDDAETLLSKSEVGATDTPELQALKQAFSASAQLQLGKRAEAEATLAKVLTNANPPVQARILEARIAASKGQLDQAITLLDNVLASEPNNIDALFLKAEVFKDKSDVAQLESSYQAAVDAIKLEKSFQRFLALRGLAHAQILASKADAARTTVETIESSFFKRLLKDDPQLIYVQTLLAYDKKDFTSAKELGERLLGNTEQFPAVLLLLGTINTQQGNLEQGESQLAQFSQKYPNHEPSRKLLSYIHLQKQNPQQALDTLKPSINDSSDLPTLKLIANAALQTGDTKASKQYFEKALGKAPDDSSLRLGLIRSFIFEENYDEAIEELNELAKDEANRLFANLSIVRVYIKSKDYDNALATLETLSEEEKAHPLVDTMKGTILLMQNDKPAGKEALLAALEKEANYVPALRQLAIVAAQEEDTEQAQAYFQQALDNSPSETKIAEEFAGYLTYLNKDEESLEVLKKAQEATPSEDVALQIAFRHLENKQPLKAFSALTPYKDSGSAEVHVFLGHSYMQQEEYTQALDAYKKAETFKPKSAFIHYLKAAPLRSLERVDEARDSLQKSLELNPDAVPTILALGQLEAMQGNFDYAIKALSGAIKRDPNNAQLIGITAAIVAKSGNREEAQKLYLKSFDLLPTAALAEQIAANYLQSNTPEQAAPFLERATNKITDSARLHNLLASIYIDQGEQNKAIDQFEKAVSADESDARALNNLAWLIKESDTERAYGYAQKALQLDPENSAIKDTVMRIEALR
ncbi:XrtA/PEP-CTERM system TPR-repeat protein PrsT [Neptunomonas marina]|uniref:PEP-CTERM system TPR-repeat protein PrsT n=1 Tax=Neptunomonas marina TaxID=1815562 RepID=A0A437Q7F2_9GAMM|nr:XrtA/PEP-CTERM system TPR-repeat protein PrsT [Neptunomonas marina]RVU30406.1 PEP-CTERM system TPR-repeat protein PrsT [Neptunomonas marina]